MKIDLEEFNEIRKNQQSIEQKILDFIGQDINSAVEDVDIIDAILGPRLSLAEKYVATISEIKYKEILYQLELQGKIRGARIGNKIYYAIAEKNANKTDGMFV